MNDLLSQFIGKVISPFSKNISQPTPPSTAVPGTEDNDPLKKFLGSVTAKAQENVAALKSKSPFLAKLGGDTTDVVHKVAGALDTAIDTNSANVRDFLKGQLPVTGSDVASGVLSTAEGIGKLAQGFNAGILRILKSAATAVSPDIAESPLAKLTKPIVDPLSESVAGSERISTYQEIYSKANDYALTNKATPTGAKIFAGSAVLGSLFMDNPLFGPEGAGLKLADDVVEKVAKATTEDAISVILKTAGVPEDVAAHIAPVLVKTSTKDEVHAAVAQINKGVGAAKAISQGQTPQERGFITSVKEELPQLGDRVAGQYIPRDTDELSMRARDLINKDIEQAVKIADEGTDDMAVATAVQLIKHYTAAGEKAADPALRNALFDKAADVTNNIAAKLTELGRSVQAASILARQTPEGMVRFASRTIQKFNETAPAAKRIPELTGEQVADISGKVKTVQQMSDGTEKAAAFQKVMDEIHDLVPTPLFRKIISVWKAGLLTGLKTTGLNTFSNLFHGISEIAKDVPATAIDKLASLFTGKRTIALTTRGLPSGFSEGTRKGWNYFKTGFDERNMAPKVDMGRVNFGDSTFAKAVQRYEETVFRAMGAEDQPFYYGAKAHSLYSQALAEAKNQGLKGSKATDFINEAIANPTDEMIRNATLDAEMAVFQNDTGLARAASAIKKAVPASEIILPFTRTPAAVAMQMVNYSPIGLVKEIGTQIKRGSFDQRLFSQAAGRAAVGVGALYLGGQLFDNGRMTLGRPTGERAQDEQQLEGAQPNSIKIGDSWRQVAALGPVGLNLLLGGYLRDGIQKTGSVWGGLTEAAGGLGQTLTQQTFLSGVNQFIDAINDPVNYAHGLFTGLVGSLVPTIVGDVARGTDTAERATPGLLDAAKAKIPGVRETLQPKVNVFGQPVKTPDFLTVMLDPSRPTRVSTDPAVLELKRLSKAGEAVVPTQLGNKGGYTSLTQKENTALWMKTGQLIKQKLTALFATDKYKKMSDADKAKTVSSFTDKANTLVRAEMVLHKTAGLQGAALTAELKKLKASGLMTQPVYDLYKKAR